MARTADYAIQGFLYQFNKTLHAVLTGSDDAEIVVEGIVEDIDIHDGAHVEAIQCKYHETVEVFSLSAIYKPILQMMGHFHRNVAAGVKYHLYAHFPSKNGIESLTSEQLRTVLATSNQDLIKLATPFKQTIDLDAFLQQFTLEFGASLDDLIVSVHTALSAVGFGPDDIPPFIYPNALQHIADLSIKHDPALRRLTKPSLVLMLRQLKSTTISRWTLALKSFHRVLESRKKQLRANLAKNARRRYFIISPTAASDFNEGIVVFIADYLDKYHSKPNHTETPIFCVRCDDTVFDGLRQRMVQKGLRFADGYVGTHFYPELFSRKPVINVSKGEIVDRDFAFRLARYDPSLTPRLLTAPSKCDDLFIFAHEDYQCLDTRDVNVEHLETITLQQAKYLLGVSDAYD